MRKHINWIKTIYANFRMLPIDQAVKLPIVVYSNVSLLSTSGKVKINVKPRFALLTIGIPWYGVVNHPGRTYFYNSGIIEINGFCKFANGSRVNIQGGVLSIGNNSLIAENVRIGCMHSIKIGSQVRIAHETQIFDTNFHFIYNDKKKLIKNCIKGVELGDKIWIGNRCIISGGTILPNNTVVSQLSLLNKDYSSLNEKGLLLGGIPAKVLGTNMYRVFDTEFENKLREFFKCSGDEPFVNELNINEL